MIEAGNQNYVAKRRSLWDKTWRNNEGHIVIFQWPNIWLIGWAAFNFVSVLSPTSPTRTIGTVSWWIGFALLSVWALLEIFKGDNYFRRFLGVFIFGLNIFLGIRTIL